MRKYPWSSWCEYVFMPSYRPVILAKRARDLRKQTGHEAYYAPIETQKLSVAQRFENILARPFKVLFQEPMLIAITIYMSVSTAYRICIGKGSHWRQFIYGCLYLLFEAYPIVFTEGHHLRPGPSGLVFLPIPIGGILSVLVVRWYSWSCCPIPNFVYTM